MRGTHRRLLFVRVAVVVAVPVVIVAQAAGATQPAQVLAARVHNTSTSVTTTSTTEATTTTAYVAPAPTTTTTWGRDAAPVALTFDDGPNETYTPQVLDALARYGVKATFFMVGAEVERFPAMAQRVVSEGHTVGNHTWDHADLPTLDDEGFRKQVDRTQDILAAVVGATESCVRPPRGRMNAYAHEQLRLRGLRSTNWSTDSADWKRPGVNAIVNRTLAGAKPGAVILFHDGGPDLSQTVAALPAIIEGIRARGLRLAPICIMGSA